MVVLNEQAEQILIDRWVESNPEKPRLDEAWLVEYAIPVWALIGHLEAVGGDIAQVAADYHVPRESVEAALAYYGRHRGIIDARIAANALL